MTNEAQIGDKYKHIKTGRLYKIVGFVIHCTNGEHEDKQDVIYQSFEDRAKSMDDKFFSRVESEFLEKFEKVGG